MIRSQTLTLVLEKIGKGIEHDPKKNRLVLIGRNLSHRTPSLEDRLVSLDAWRAGQSQKQETEDATSQRQTEEESD